MAAVKRYRTRRLASLMTKCYYLHKRKRDEKMYNILCDEFVSLGGVYIKFLQGVMLQSQVMRKWHSPNRLKIFENLESEQIDIVGLLRKELGADRLKQIALVQPEPFAAGSFGQVYYGQHVNGKPIIVKVLRPMIRELLKHDLWLLARFSKSFFVKMYPRNMEVDINEAAKDFRNATLRETDYVAEAEFACELYGVYRNHPKMVIPETFLDLCTTHIIVQEYIEGISVAQLVRLQEQGIDPKEYVLEHTGSDLDEQLVTLGVEALDAIFNLSRVQGDPHPGNIRLMTDNRVGMIDFGISAPTPRNKAAFFGLLDEWNRLYSDGQNIMNLFEQFMRFFVSDLYRALKRLSTMARRDDQEEDSNFTREVGRVAQQTFSSVMGTQDIRPLLADGRILQIINQMINKDNRFGLVMRLEASEVLRAAQTYITLIESLRRRDSVLPRVFSEVIAKVDREHPELRHQQEDTMSVGAAIETVTRWLERVAQRDPALFRQLMTKIRISGDKPLAAAVKEATGDA
jgi:predicted unusual protein kinase regulating ubiquinone biosynthesis (AarF/ABC1/UbiB family)